MGIENKFARFMRNTGPARFLVPIGIILIVFGIILSGLNTDKYVETTGKVISVEEAGYDDDGRAEYDVSFTFSADGKEHSGVFPGLTDNYKAGDSIKVFYDPSNPDKTSNGRMSGIIAPVMIIAGAAALIGGIVLSIRAFKKSKELDASATGEGVRGNFEGFKTRSDVREFYCSFDGKTLHPGYVVEDAGRNIVYEGKMTKQALVGPRTFEFNNHISGTVTEHKVGHTATTSYSGEMFSEKSWFKFDGENIWDLIHKKGMRLNTNIHSKFPNLIYELSKDGKELAVIETSSRYVHEEDEAEHTFTPPIGRYFYRIWTVSDDLDPVFLAVFAISETEQTIVE